MAFDYNTAFRRIIAKTQLLQDKYLYMQQARDEALAKVEMLQDEIAAKDKELQALRMQVEYMQIASTIAPTREQVEKTRATIAGLVRDIDRCITDLSD